MNGTDTDDGDLRAALHGYVTGGEPPLGLTSSGAVTAGRRAARRRMTLQALGAAAAVVVTVVGAAQLVAHPAAPRPPVAATQQPQPSSAAPSERSCTGLVTGPDADDDDRRLAITCYLTATLPGMLPGATLSQPPGQAAPAGTLPLHAYPHSWAYGFNADALVTDAAGVGLVFIVVEPREPANRPPDKESCAAPSCQRRTGPRGEVVGIYTKPEKDGTSTGTSVVLYSAGSTVSATAANHTPTTLMATRPAPPLTLDQLWQLATEPRLQVYG